MVLCNPGVSSEWVWDCWLFQPFSQCHILQLPCNYVVVFTCVGQL